MSAFDDPTDDDARYNSEMRAEHARWLQFQADEEQRAYAREQLRELDQLLDHADMLRDQRKDEQYGL